MLKAGQTVSGCHEIEEREATEQPEGRGGTKQKEEPGLKAGKAKHSCLPATSLKASSFLV